MAIVEKDGLRFLDGLNSDFIVVESTRIDDYCHYINSNQITSVAFIEGYYDAENLDMILKCPGIQRVNINSFYIEDYSALHSLSKLKSLYCNEVRDFIDLTAFSCIEELAVESNKRISGIESCRTLKELFLWKYKPKTGNLEEISVLSQLEYLVITQSTIKSLEGCSGMQKLKKLELNYLSDMEYLDALEGIADSLKILRFDCCKKIKNHEYVTCLRELELLAFDECGNISSIGFIRKLPNLKSFIFVNTNIDDGDLSPCIGLEYVGFLKKRHYSHKNKDFNTNK